MISFIEIIEQGDMILYRKEDDKDFTRVEVVNSFAPLGAYVKLLEDYVRQTRYIEEMVTAGTVFGVKACNLYWDSNILIDPKRLKRLLEK